MQSNRRSKQSPEDKAEKQIRRGKTNEKKPFTCLVCNKSFLKKSNLRGHLESVHEKLTRFQCDDCQAAFYYKRHFLKHMDQHKKAWSRCFRKAFRKLQK